MAGVHLLEGLCSRVPHLVDREVFALLKGLPTFITDIITYLCNVKRETVIGSADFLVHEMHTGSCPRLLVESEFLPLPRVPRVMARYRFTGKAGRAARSCTSLVQRIVGCLQHPSPGVSGARWDTPV